MYESNVHSEKKIFNGLVFVCKIIKFGIYGQKSYKNLIKKKKYSGSLCRVKLFFFFKLAITYESESVQLAKCVKLSITASGNDKVSYIMNPWDAAKH